MFAEAFVAGHHGWLENGWRLTSSSGLWWTTRNGVTGRFVYRHPAGDTLTFVLRGLPWQALG